MYAAAERAQSRDQHRGVGVDAHPTAVHEHLGSFGNIGGVLLAVHHTHIRTHTNTHGTRANVHTYTQHIKKAREQKRDREREGAKERESERERVSER